MISELEEVGRGEKNGLNGGMSVKATNDMNEEYEEVAQVFVEQYNPVNGTHYEFERLRESVFGNPKYGVPGFEIHQIAFIEGKRRRRSSIGKSFFKGSK